MRKDGRRIWVNEFVTAVRDGDGALVGFTKISRDQGRVGHHDPRLPQRPSAPAEPSMEP